MPKFTSGEWRCCDGTQFGEQVLFVDIKDNEAVVCRLTKVVNKEIPLSDEDIANAHLIATAPDMYAMLEDSRTMLRAFHKNTGSMGAISQVRFIDELLKKARGE